MRFYHSSLMPNLLAHTARFTKNDLLGDFSLSLPFLYAQPNHELHRQWLMLTDLRKTMRGEEQPSAPEVTGKLRCSIVVLGSNDKQKLHDEQEDIKAELYRGDEVDRTLMPSSLAQNVVFLKVTDPTKQTHVSGVMLS
jgi:hypothetical protein